jgi:beta-xylosidase
VPEPQISEFESRVLEADWRWINEDDTHWTLSEAPGTLRIVSQGGAPAGDLQNAPNVLVRDAPDGHFDLLTEVTFNPTSHCQYASIFVQLDDGSVVSLSRSYCEEDEASHCVGSGIYFDASDLGCDPIGVPTSDETVRMLLRKAGRTYIGYRKEGEGWGDVIEIGRCSSSATPSIVGLTAFNSDREIPQIAADFDYFTVQERQ